MAKDARISMGLKIITALTLALGLLAMGILADLGLDGGRYTGALFGRDQLVAACLPALVTSLSHKGYAPSDLELEARPAIGSLFGNGRSLQSRFTFADGPGESRIDGIMACLVEGQAVRVEFRATALPRRTA